MMKIIVIFFCKQKTAYDMRISDWSSDVCSSDLFLHRHGEFGGLALQIFDRIFVGESDLQHLLVAGLDADELVFEAGDQLARTDFDRHILTRAAVKGDAVDAAGEVDDDLVALGGLLGLRRVLEPLPLRRSEEHTSELQ